MPRRFAGVRSRTLCASASLAVFFLSAMPPAQAEMGTIGRTAYLRDGPGVQYRPVDEAVAGTAADVGPCRDGWCRVAIGGRAGYLPEGALGGAVSGPDPSRQVCFVNREAGYGDGRDIRLCHSTGPKP